MPALQKLLSVPVRRDGGVIHCRRDIRLDASLAERNRV